MKEVSRNQHKYINKMIICRMKLSFILQFLILVQICSYQGYFVQAATNHVPQFMEAFDWKRIPEEEPIGTYLMKATANDVDGDVIRYSLNDPSGNFVIDSIKGDIKTAKIIDREKLPPGSSSVNFEIIAWELKRPDQKSSPQKIEVHISDKNDNDPLFQQKTYSAQVSEDVPVGSFVVAVKATDLDDPPELLYQITKGNEDGYFAIGHYDGKIRTQKELDYEHVKDFILTIEVADDRPSVRSRKRSYVDVNIRVKDEDDQGAYFAGNYSTTLIEGYHQGKKIAVVYAKDGDEGIDAKVQYAIDDKTNTNSLFSINSNGEVFVRGNVDREQNPSFRLQLLAQEEQTGPFPVSSSHAPGRAELLITVLDRNDNAPQFEYRNYVAHVKEHTKINTVILVVKASDVDLDENAVFKYLLEEEDNKFGINQQGEIFVTQDLDREVDYKYDFKVVARQSGIQDSKADVHIFITDQNDHHPVFTKTLYEGRVKENMPAGTYVTTVSATDLDIQENADITYHILPDAEGSTQCFHVDSKTGEIRTACKLDREKKAMYLFLVEATDNSKEKEKSSDTKVSVQVEDQNDERPTFKTINFYKSVHYDEKINTPVVQLEASDPDSGLFGDVTYRIVRGNNDNRFHMDSASGTIKVADSLAAYSGRIIELVVEAYDNNGNLPTLLSTQNAIVTVTIDKKGDNSVVLLFLKPVSYILKHAEVIQSELSFILGLGIEVDSIEKTNDVGSSTFIFHGYHPRTQVVRSKKDIIRDLKNTRLDEMVRFRLQWNLTKMAELDNDIIPNIIKDSTTNENDDAAKKKTSTKWHPIIYAVLGFSALIAVFGVIGIIYLIKSKRRNYDDRSSASLTSSRIPIAAREQARKLWTDENFESVSQIGARQESYVESSGFLETRCDQYELDPSNMYGKRSHYLDDPFSDIVPSPPASSSNGSENERAASIFAASSVMTVMTAYNPVKQDNNKQLLPRDMSREQSTFISPRDRKISPRDRKNSYKSPRDRKLSTIIDDEGKRKTLNVSTDSDPLMRRPPSYEYDLDEKLAMQFDCDV